MKICEGRTVEIPDDWSQLHTIPTKLTGYPL